MKDFLNKLLRIILGMLLILGLASCSSNPYYDKQTQLDPRDSVFAVFSDDYVKSAFPYILEQEPIESPTSNMEEYVDEAFPYVANWQN